MNAAAFPKLNIGTTQIRGIRFVRLTHLVDWLEDLEDYLTERSGDQEVVALIRETLQEAAR